MSGFFTVCGNYVTPELPRENWFNWRYTVEAVDEDGAPSMAGLEVMAEVSEPIEVEVGGRAIQLMPRAAAYAAVHPDDVPWEEDLCLAYLEDAEDFAAEEEDNELSTFTVCGTLEDWSCGSWVWEAPGKWSAYLAVRQDLEEQGRTFYLAAVHPLEVPAYPTLVFADAVSKTTPMMALTARETWGVTR